METLLHYGFYFMVVLMIAFVFVGFKAIGISLNKAVERAEAEENLTTENITLKDIQSAANNHPQDIGVLYDTYKNLSNPQWHSQEFLDGYLHSIKVLINSKK